jgi:ribonuclease-3
LSIRNNFASFSQSLASLLSPGVSQDALVEAIGEEQANMLAALREMKNEGQLPWLPKAKLVPIVPISEATPDNDGKAYPPPLPIIIDDDLRTSVFTHRSAIPGEDDSKAGTEKRHYERLEFLGDAYLQSITSHILYSRFQTIREGSLSEMRQNLVSNKPLAKYAELYDMHKKIRSGGSLQVTKDNMTKIVADCFEAYLGAVILDHDDRYVGIKVVTEWLEKLFEPKIWEMENLRNREIPLNKMAKQELNVIAVCGGPRGTKLTYKWTSGGGGNNGGFWITVYLDGWGWVQKELGKGWALKKL